MTTPTASEVNKRIAEFCGWQRIGCLEVLTCYPPIPVYSGLPPGIDLEKYDRGGYGLQSAPMNIPNYMHDANASIAALEKYCRERKAWTEFALDGEDAAPAWCVVIGLDMNDVRHESLPTAISLALFTVLGEGS